MLNVCVAGATGWTGRAVAEGVRGADDLRLVSAVARRSAGRDLGEAWDGEQIGVPVYGSVADALDSAEADVVVDYTAHDVVRAHVDEAVRRSLGVVVGSSGLSAADFEEIDSRATEAGVGVIASGNFSVTAAMAQAAAVLVAEHQPSSEVIDYAGAGKADVPSGTAQELAEKLGGVRPTTLARSLADTSGPVEARGASIAGTQVHSVRLPSFVVSTEVVFGLPDERLSIRHDAGSSAAPYVAGTLLAVRR